jgi:CDP-paratose 2-epimerase
MATVLVTGSGGLVGSEAVRFFAGRGFDVVGIDNDLRGVFFGGPASTLGNRNRLLQEFPHRYQHYHLDVRDRGPIESLFREFGGDLVLVVHAAGQPSPDRAALDPHADFTVNANGTLVLLEALRRHAPDAVFVFTSTGQVYGDRPNRLPLVELETRWEVEPTSRWHDGIDESLSLDRSQHSLFGVSKAAADLLVQEYGRSFGLRTACFRCGCVAGPAQAGGRHGFLAGLMDSVRCGQPYTLAGHRGKQVRDVIHSYDLVNAFWHFSRAPRSGEVYNLGGSRHCHCSLLEAVALCEQISGRRLPVQHVEVNRPGDQVWYVSDVSKFRAHYPGWGYCYDLRGILEELHQDQALRRSA